MAKKIAITVVYSHGDGATGQIKYVGTMSDIKSKIRKFVRDGYRNQTYATADFADHSYSAYNQHGDVVTRVMPR